MSGLAWLLTRLVILAVGFILVQLSYIYWPLAEVRGSARLGAVVSHEYALASDYAGPTVRVAVSYIGRLLASVAPQAPRATAGEASSHAARDLYKTYSMLSNRLALRLGVLIAVIPLYLLLGLAALVDGYVARQERRLAGGPESSFVYHRVKRMLLLGAGVAAVLHLWSPWPLDPRLIFAVHIALHTVLLRQWMAEFKKYL